MNRIKLNIVGIPYREELKGRVDEFLVAAPGKSMTIRAESANENDRLAIRAYDWLGRHVGYVSKTDMPTAWGVLRCAKCGQVRGKITKTNIKHPCVIFECDVENYQGPATDLYPKQPFLDWKYTGPMLGRPDLFDTLDYMKEEISERLEERDTWDEEALADFLTLAMSFTEKSKYDISGEMSDYRACLILRLMRKAKADEFDELIEALTMASGRSGRETTCGAVLNFWTDKISSVATQKHLRVHMHEYDVEKVEHELEQFPFELYYEWKENAEMFVSKLYYLKVPLEVIWKLISGIGLVSLKRMIAKKQDKIKAENTKRNIIITGDNAQYIENPNELQT